MILHIKVILSWSNNYDSIPVSLGLNVIWGLLVAKIKGTSLSAWYLNLFPRINPVLPFVHKNK